MHDATTVQGDSAPAQRSDAKPTPLPCQNRREAAGSGAGRGGDNPVSPAAPVRRQPAVPYADLHSGPPRTAASSGKAEDDLLAFILIRTWTLATGRVLRSDVPPAKLSEEELIAFWADDHIAHEEPGAPLLRVPGRV